MNYENKTLLLNATYEPLTLTTWQHAITLVYKDKAYILEDKGEKVHSAHDSYPKPSVIVLQDKVKTPRLRVKFSRKNVYKRDNFKCQYCGEEHEFHNLTFDHVVPKSRGGETNWENIVACCFDCNTKKKADKTPKEADMSLIKKPEKPRWTPLEKIGIENPPSEWEPYLWK